MHITWQEDGQHATPALMASEHSACWLILSCSCGPAPRDSEIHIYAASQDSQAASCAGGHYMLEVCTTSIPGASTTSQVATLS